MKKGDIVKVTTQCVPKGLVPVWYAKLLYKYSTEYDGKWYATEVYFTMYEKLTMENVVSIDSHRIYKLKSELVEGELA